MIDADSMMLYCIWLIVPPRCSACYISWQFVASLTMLGLLLRPRMLCMVRTYTQAAALLNQNMPRFVQLVNRLSSFCWCRDFWNRFLHILWCFLQLFWFSSLPSVWTLILTFDGSNCDLHSLLRLFCNWCSNCITNLCPGKECI